jgi:hypothetical protein
MENKDIIIITLAILAIYLYLKCHGYLDDYKAHLDSDLKDINENKEIFQELRNQVNHYQTLYQKRVEKDLGYSQSSQATQTEDDQLITQHQEQLRKINVLFDEKSKDYEFIDFNGLYSLLSQIAERERERERESKITNLVDKEIKPVFSRYRKLKK